MTQERRKLLLCNCNRTMPLDGKAVAGALELDEAPHIHSELCRRHIAAFEAAVKSGDDLVVACTQEAPLFTELRGDLKGAGGISFVNIRETAGWSAEAEKAAPKIAALLALAADAGAGSGAGGVLPVGGATADHRPGGRRALLGGSPQRTIAGQRADRERQRPGRSAAAAPLSGASRDAR